MVLLVLNGAVDPIAAVLPRHASDGHATTIAFLAPDGVISTTAPLAALGYRLVDAGTTAASVSAALSASHALYLVGANDVAVADALARSGAADVIRAHERGGGLLIVNGAAVHALGSVVPARRGTGVRRVSGLNLLHDRMHTDAVVSDLDGGRALIVAGEGLLIDQGQARVIGSGSDAPIDTTVLRRTITRAEVKAVWPHLNAEYPPGRTASWGMVIVVAISVAAMVGIVLLPGSQASMAALIEARGLAAFWQEATGGLLLISPLAWVLILFSWDGFRTLARRRSRREWVLMAAFAAQNRMHLIRGEIDLPLLPKPLRSHGSLTDAVSLGASRPAFAANFAVDAAPLRGTGHGGIIAVRVNSDLPAVFAASRRARRFTFGLVPSAGQRLRLEGDFDRHFSVSVQRGRETDALYLLSPDVMATLIDDVADFDIEIGGRWIRLTSPRDVVTPDPERWERADRAVRAIADRVEQWERWRPAPLALDELAAARGGTKVRMRWSFGMLLRIVLLAAAPVASIFLLDL